MRIFAVNAVQLQTAAGKPSKPRGNHAHLSVALIPLTLVFLALMASSAHAETPTPQWTVTSVSAPTNFAPGDESGEDVYRVVVTNTGGAESDGEPVTITDVLPAGLTLDRAHAEGYVPVPSPFFGARGASLSCGGVTCTFSGRVVPEGTLVVTIPVDVASSPPPSCAVPAGAVSCVKNVVRVSGGGALAASMQTPTVISEQPAGFDIAPGSTTSTLSSTQAGAHADLTTTTGFDTIDRGGTLAGAAKEIVDALPPGFAGDLIDTPQCTIATFGRNQCPIGTQIGVQTLTFNQGKTGIHETIVTSPVYNLTPNPGNVAKLGFFVTTQFGIQGDVSVLPGTYQLQTRFPNIIEGLLELDDVSLTVWGVPTAKVHDPLRWKPGEHSVTEGAFGVSSDNALVPYLASPTSCTAEPVAADISVFSWQEPEREVSTQTPFGPLSGCERLKLPATFTVAPTTQEAYAPTGLNAELGVHQTYEDAEGISSAHLNKAVVTLPEGITVNPSAGSGLGVARWKSSNTKRLKRKRGRAARTNRSSGR